MRVMRKVNETRSCSHCASPFHPQYGRPDNSYCSRACYLRARWGTVTPKPECPVCGEPCTSTGRRKQKFCSFGCRVKAQAEPRGQRNGRIRYGSKGRYYALLTPHHPHADGKGYVMEHRLVVEKAVGRFLTADEVVHHVDGDTRNNDMANLRLMAKADHDALHSRERWARARMQGVKRPAKAF